MIPHPLRPALHPAPEAAASNTSPAPRGTAPPRFLRAATLALAAGAAFASAACSRSSYKETRTKVVVSVKEQALAVYHDGVRERTFPVSTSKFGLGDQRGSNRTPLGTMFVAEKIGDGAPLGAVFKSRRPTGEILPPNSPGRDPIVSRILWLQGTEKQNRNSYNRYIYIHGTVEEKNIGKPVSYGCIRMRSVDVAGLFHRIPKGTTVQIVKGGLPGREKMPATPDTRPAPTAPTPPEPSHPVENIASEFPAPPPNKPS